jgi:asparagine synthetase A
MNKILNKLLARIRASLNVDDKEFKKLIDQYVDEQNLPLKMQQVSLRANLTKSIGGEDDLTMKMFLKALKVLKITKIQFSVKAVTKDGKEISTPALPLDMED